MQPRLTHKLNGTMRLFIIFVLLITSSAFAYSQEQNQLIAVDGYVTGLDSSTHFVVNGKRVICTAKTNFAFPDHTIRTKPDWTNGPYIGEPLLVYGKTNRKKHTVTATEIASGESGPARIKGSGVIDRVLSSMPGSNSILVRADGYPVLVTKKVATFYAPVSSISQIGTNVWIMFEGQQRADGVVVASKAAVFPNVIEHSEESLRKKAEYDPATVDPKKKQSAVSKAFIGVELKKLPPYKDPAMQARIDRIGESLIPAYQRALPDSDPTKIHFRFQLIDNATYRNALTWPSGIILVPRQAVERMQNDSQLATVLAGGIAFALEKQGYREMPAVEGLNITTSAAIAGAFLVPGVGAAALGADVFAVSKVVRDSEEESGRVSLGLLMDAKYDIRQTPIAWWLLASKKPKDLANVAMPYRAKYLYRIFGTTWRNEVAATP